MNRTAIKFSPADRFAHIKSTLESAQKATDNRNALHRELASLVYGTEAYKVTRAAFDQENGRMIALRSRWIREAEQFHNEFAGNVDKRRTIAGLIAQFPTAGLKTGAAEFAAPDRTVLTAIEF